MKETFEQHIAVCSTCRTGAPCNTLNRIRDDFVKDKFGNILAEGEGITVKTFQMGDRLGVGVEVSLTDVGVEVIRTDVPTRNMLFNTKQAGVLYTALNKFFSSDSCG